MCRVNVLAILVVLSLGGGAGVVHAQAEVGPEERELPIIVGVSVEGARDVSGAEAARSILGLDVGDRLDPSQVRQGIKRVFLTGPWADVQVWSVPAEGGVRLILRLIPDQIIGDVVVTSEGDLPAEILRAGIDLSSGQRFDETNLTLAEEAILARCRDLGYPRAEVERIVERQNEAEVQVEFAVTEGPPTVVKELLVVGPQVISTAEMEDLLELQVGGPFNRLALDEGLTRAVEFLVARRHLGASARVVTVDYRKEGLEVELTVEVVPGPRYHVVYVGNEVIPGAYLYDLLNERSLTSLEEADLEKAKRTIERYYRENGFAKVKVRTDQVPAYAPWDEGADRLVRFILEEGPRAHIDEIYIEGVKAKDPEELTEDIWDFVRAEAPRTTLLQRLDMGDVDEILGEAAGKPDEDRQVELSDEYFGLIPDFGPTREPVYLSSIFEAAAQRISDLYQTDGFLEVVVHGPEPMFTTEGDKVRVRYRIEEGPQVMVSSVRYTPEPTLPREDLAAVTTFVPGAPANLYAIEETRLRLERVLQERGFPFARVTEALERGDDPGQADVVYSLDEGPRVRVGRVEVRGNDRTRDFVILDRLVLDEGEWLSSSAIENSRRRLLRLGLFSSATIEVAPGSSKRTVRDLLVKVTERPIFGLEFGVGGSVEDGPRAFLAGEIRNPFGLGLGFRGRGQVNYPWLTYFLVYPEDDPNHPNERAAKQLPAFPLLYHFEGQALAVVELPKLYGVPFDTRLHIDGVGIREIRPAFTLMRASVLGGLEASPFSWWRSAIELEGEVSDFDCPEDNLQFGQGCGQGSIGLTRRRDAGFIQQATARVKLALDFRDDPFRPHAGVFLSWDNEVAIGSGFLRTDAIASEPERVNSDFFKTSAVASGYIPLADQFTIAISVRGGNIFPIITDDNYIPLFKRFYLGGTNSVRGFFPDAILPADHPNWPANQADPDRGAEDLADARNSLGGNFFVNGRGELRVGLIGDLDLGIFVDAGELLTDVRAFQLAGFAAGAGIGFRYNTPVGPFAIDVGWRILDGQRRLPPLLSLERLNVHFSIGYF